MSATNISSSDGFKQNGLASSSVVQVLGSSRPWWNLCFVYGDQTKYYKQLYGKRTQIRRLQRQMQNATELKCAKCGQSDFTIYGDGK